MGETPGHRDAIDRMTKQLKTNNPGQMSAQAARKIARDAAIRADRRKNK